VTSIRALALLAALWCLQPVGWAATGPGAAYVLVYHHVDRNTPESTSVSPEQFAEHMNYLESNGFRVVPLKELLEAVAHHRDPPARSVAITFDDAYPSVLGNALPVLEYHGWPFTVFVSTEAIDRGTPAYLDWDQLRELEKHRGTIGNHSYQHGHLLAREADETESEWRERIRGDIRFAQARLDAELKNSERLFAYPYGEFDPDLVGILADMGYLAVGQQSGPLGASSNPYAAPRFPMTRATANLPQLEEKLNSLPFSVVEPKVPATVVVPTDTRPTLELHIAPGPYHDNEFTCYVADQEPARIEWQPGTTNVVRITARDALPVGRSKYTCTAPHETIPGVYYWHTHLFMRLPADGGWYAG